MFPSLSVESPARVELDESKGNRAELPRWSLSPASKGSVGAWPRKCLHLEVPMNVGRDAWILGRVCVEGDGKWRFRSTSD